MNKGHEGFHGVCSPKLLTSQPHTCVLTSGDFLYAPAGWYHSTCHLDAVSVALIQWVDDEAGELSERKEEMQRRYAAGAAFDASLFGM